MSTFSSSSSEIYVIPGQNVTSLILSNNNSNDVIYGDGLYCKTNNDIYTSIAGILKFRKPNTYWVENNSKLYIPMKNDQVVGIIEDKGSEYYKVNICSSNGTYALLNRLSFEGATKRNKPEFNVGDIVYAVVTKTNKDFDTEISCISNSINKKEWSSGETLYGQLKNGIVIKLTPNIARKLLLPHSVVINELGKHFIYEVTIGMNGIVWLRGSDIFATIVIRNCIINSEYLNNIEIIEMIKKFASSK